MRFFVLLMILGYNILKTEASEKNFFDLHEKGWHWYKGENEKKEEPGIKKDSKSIFQNPIDELKEYQKKIEDARARAVMHPTPKNIEIYQYLQYEALERANRFSSVWMENVYKNPELNYALKSPTSHKARHIYLKKQERVKIEKITELSKEYGLFYFFKESCEYCDAFALIVKSFSKKYNWEVLAISEFGENSELFERNVKDNGLADTWGVSTYPSLFAVNPKTGDVIPVANGMISIEEMEDRIIAITNSGEEDA